MHIHMVGFYVIERINLNSTLADRGSMKEEERINEKGERGKGGRNVENGREKEE